MKIGLYADPHLSQSSSIIIGRSGEFTGRLDNLIKSFKWINDLFKKEGCEEVFCLGDMTDKPNLTAEEITAMSYCNIQHHRLLVGNHCRSDSSGKFNSLSIFEKVYYLPEVVELGGVRILILPYSKSPIDLTEFHNIDIILSHNDIKGYNFGRKISEFGYEIGSILSNCKLFINGHLHNGGWVVKDRIINLGQMSGINFSSCGGEWEPSVGVLDTETLEVVLYENPEAYRFKKEEFTTLVGLKMYLNNLPEIGRYVVQATVPSKISQQSRKLLSQSKKVSASRVLTSKDRTSSINSQKEDKKVFETSSVYDKLRDFVNLQKNLKVDKSKVFEVITSVESKEGAD